MLFERRLSEFFDRVEETVVAAHPRIQGGRSLRWFAPGRFHGYWSAMYDRASQRYEDLIVSLAIDKTNHWRMADGSARWPELGDSPIALLEIERGTGHTFTEFDPLALPDDLESSNAQSLLSTYIAAGEHRFQQIVDDLLEALATPYDVDSA